MRGSRKNPESDPPQGRYSGSGAGGGTRTIANGDICDASPAGSPGPGAAGSSPLISRTRSPWRTTPHLPEGQAFLKLRIAPHFGQEILVHGDLRLNLPQVQLQFFALVNETPVGIRLGDERASGDDQKPADQKE